jgi:hypothetical protein
MKRQALKRLAFKALSCLANRETFVWCFCERCTCGDIPLEAGCLAGWSDRVLTIGVYFS